MSALRWTGVVIALLLLSVGALYGGNQAGVKPAAALCYRSLQEISMTPKDELVRELRDLEDEYRFWLVEAIIIERGLSDMEEQVDQHAHELGPERTADFRSRLARTRERHLAIEDKIRYVRRRLEEMHQRLKDAP
jgi:hypothetical protein